VPPRLWNRRPIQRVSNTRSKKKNQDFQFYATVALVRERLLQ
jgi:hypothetical protein